MADYIDREKIFSIWRSMPAPASVTSLAAAISQTPAADVAQVVHGRWVNHFDYMMERSGFFVCDSCKKMSREKYDYCPNCGARMGKEDEHEAG